MAPRVRPRRAGRAGGAGNTGLIRGHTNTVDGQRCSMAPPAPSPGTDSDAMGWKTGPDRSGATEEGDHGQVRARHDRRHATARGHGWLGLGGKPPIPPRPTRLVPTRGLGGQLGVPAPVLGCSLLYWFLFVLSPSLAPPAPRCHGSHFLVPGGRGPSGGDLALSAGPVLPACPYPTADSCTDLQTGWPGEEVQGRHGLPRGQLCHRLRCYGGELVPRQDSPADLGKACWWGAQIT